MPKYSLEFILETTDISQRTIEDYIQELGEGLGIADDGGEGKTKKFKITIFTEDPTIIFDACAQFGRIKSVKVGET